MIVLSGESGEYELENGRMFVEYFCRTIIYVGCDLLKEF